MDNNEIITPAAEEAVEAVEEICDYVKEFYR